jgi:hypothetical protein
LVARFGVEAKTWTAFSVYGTVWFFAKWVSALNDESWNYAVKGSAIVESNFSKVEKVIHVARSYIGVKPNSDVAKFRRDYDFGVFPFESKRCAHGLECSN